jgi:guanine nucleotide-binding protein G(i) subunit alpha
MEENETVKLDNKLKVLILGIAESGKTSLVKQLWKHMGSGYSDQELIGYEYVLYSNILQNIYSLTSATTEFDSSENKELAQKINELVLEQDAFNCIHQVYDEQVHKACVTLWRDSGVQKTFSNSFETRVQYTDNIVFLLDEAPERFTPPYRMTPSMFMYLKNKTSAGYVAERVEYMGRKMVFYDLGGARSERKKWPSMFQEIGSICSCFLCVINLL